MDEKPKNLENLGQDPKTGNFVEQKPKSAFEKVIPAPDGTIKGNPRTFAVEKVEGKFKKIE